MEDGRKFAPKPQKTALNVHLLKHCFLFGSKMNGNLKFLAHKGLFKPCLRPSYILLFLNIQVIRLMVLSTTKFLYRGMTRNFGNPLIKIRIFAQRCHSFLRKFNLKHSFCLLRKVSISFLTTFLLDFFRLELTYLASKARAKTPAASGAAADVPE